MERHAHDAICLLQESVDVVEGQRRLDCHRSTEALQLLIERSSTIGHGGGGACIACVAENHAGILYDMATLRPQKLLQKSIDRESVKLQVAFLGTDNAAYIRRILGIQLPKRRPAGVGTLDHRKMVTERPPSKSTSTTSYHANLLLRTTYQSQCRSFLLLQSAQNSPSSDTSSSQSAEELPLPVLRRFGLASHQTCKIRCGPDTATLIGTSAGSTTHSTAILLSSPENGNNAVVNAQLHPTRTQKAMPRCVEGG